MSALNSFLTVMLASILVNLSNPSNHTRVMNPEEYFHEPPPSCDSDQPLFLTPYLEKGDIETARCMSKVGKLPNAPYIPSYSGLFTVNKEYDSHMFFLFFPAMNNDTKAPVILWLEGGPGYSGFYGLFTQNGPYKAHKNLSAEFRSPTWIQEFPVIYVDNPVGTGFSLTNDVDGYSTNEDEVADNLYAFLQQFFKMFHEYAKNDLYVIGESYAGKYVPAISYKIHTDGPPAQTKFKGMSIGSGFCDTETQMNFGDYFYQLGIMDLKQAAVIREACERSIKDFRKGNFEKAFFPLNNIVPQIPKLSNPNYLLKFAGYNYTYNLLQTQQPDDLTYHVEYVKSPEFKKAIHMGNLTFNSPSMKVAKILSQDIMKSVKSKMVTIMDNYRVLIYNGQLDLTFPYPQMVDLLSTADWKYRDEYKNSSRKIWKLEGKDEVAGYVNHVGHFYHVLVRLAGHMVPYEQPEYCLDMVTRFIKGKPFA